MPRRLVFVALLWATAARADDAPYVSPEFLAVTPPLPADQAGRDVWRLDLQEALRIAVRQNLDIALERKAVEIAALGVDVADGAFEPTVTASYSHDDARQPPLTSQEGGAGEILTAVDDAWRLGIAKQFTFGTTMDLQWTNSRAKSSLGTAVEPVTYRSALSLVLTQPLLRGFSSDLVVPRLEILRAKIASAREREQLATAMAAVVERTEAAYWNVLQALYGYDLALRTQHGAQEQLALTQRRIDAGTLPPSELIGAESTVAQRQLEVVTADRTIHQAWDQLRAVLHLPSDHWARPILPIDVPRFQQRPTTLDAMLASALKHRPELAAADLDVQATALAVRKADNDKLPQIDLGVAGTLVGQDDRYRTTLERVGEAEGRAWSVFVNLTWTPLQRTTDATAAIARRQLEQTEVRRDQLVQAISLEVRDALRDQETAERQLLAAARFRALAEKSLEIEQRKFLNGTSESIFVAQRQDALANARQAELAALLAHKRATATLLRASGRLLAERHIVLE